MFERAPKLEKAFQRYPQIPLFARLADQHLRRGRLRRAQALCEEGCQRFPGYPTGFFVLSRCLEQQKMWEEARAALDRGLRLDPDNPAGYRRLSRVYREMGNDTLALKCLERAAALDPLSASLGDELEQLAAAVRGAHPGQPIVERPAAESVPNEVTVTDEVALDEAGTEDDSPPVTDVHSEKAQIEPVLQVLVEHEAPTPVEPVPEPEPAPTATTEPAVAAEEGLFDIEEESLAEELPEEEPVEEQAEEEPFAQVQSQPEWEMNTIADDEVAHEQAQSDASTDDPVGIDVADAIDDNVEDEAVEPDVLVPEAEEVGFAGDEEVAALGAGLFEDDDEPAAPPPTASVTPRRAARKAPAEAEPLPVELLLEDEAEELALEVGVGPEPAPVPQQAPASRLVGRHGDVLTDLLRDLDQNEQDSSPASAEAEKVEPVPTITLAELYVEQGYCEQAMQIYQRVLQTDPENEAAQRGAAELSAS
jgi:tetratricopeptide (TPR) repeat protein